MPHRVIELQNIMPMVNIPSVMQHGILSHRQVGAIVHSSVAMEEIQDRREGKSVPGGLELHQYTNLYFCARNPMLFKIVRTRDKNSVCVLRVTRRIMLQQNVVIADRNASSDYVRFLRSPDGLRAVDFSLVFAHYWTDEDPFEQMKKKSIKCAEVLVPNVVTFDFVEGAYVASQAAEKLLLNQGFPLPITRNPQLFFA